MTTEISKGYQLFDRLTISLDKQRQYESRMAK